MSDEATLQHPHQEVLNAIAGLRSDVQAVQVEIARSSERIERLEERDHTREIREAEERGALRARSEIVFPNVFTLRNITTAGTVTGMAIGILRAAGVI